MNSIVSISAFMILPCKLGGGNGGPGLITQEKNGFVLICYNIISQ